MDSIMHLTNTWLSHIMVTCCCAMVYPFLLWIIQKLILKPLKITAHKKWSSIVGFLTILASAFITSFTHNLIIITCIDCEKSKYSLTILNMTHLVISSVLCTIHFFLLSNSFRMVIPSDVLYPGAFYQESIPCPDYSKQVTSSQRKAINLIGSKNGCHTCGTFYPSSENIIREYFINAFNCFDGRKCSNKYFADHSPPIAIIHLYHSYGRCKYYGKLIPQCPSCSYLQATCVKDILRNKPYFSNRSIVTHGFTWRSFKLYLPWLYVIRTLDNTILEDIFVNFYKVILDLYILP